jgi:ribosomal protein L6P/L9E
MSRIGKKAITIPKDVSVTYANKTILVKGKQELLRNLIINILQDQKIIEDKGGNLYFFKYNLIFLPYWIRNKDYIA